MADRDPSETLMTDETTASDGFQPGDDEPLTETDDLTVIQAIKAFMSEAEDAKVTRDRLTKQNHEANLCHQDWSGKIEGQSTEFLPKVSMALEQISAFVERGLVAFGDWFQVELTPDPRFVGGALTAEGIRKLMRHRLESPSETSPGTLDFPTLLADAIKVGGLGSLVILKVHGQFIPVRRPEVDTVPLMEWLPDPQTGEMIETQVGSEEQLVMVETKVWRPLVDLVRPEDWFPDPKGRGLYEIHRTYRDLHEVIELAEQGVYDPDAVSELTDSVSLGEDDMDLARQTDQSSGTTPSFRKQVELWEFWGTLLDSDGHVVHHQVVCTVANEQFLIRKPEPYPFWHQMSPFVVAPLVRVPFSVWHKALFDNAVALNLAMNELFNLILDGGIGAVWGIKAVKPSAIENYRQFTNGIPQGATLQVKEDFPDGVPVLQHIPTGSVPPEALAVFNLLDREFQAATKVPDAKLGLLSPKAVKATEIVSANESSSIFFDSIIYDLETKIIRPALYRYWLTMLQHVDDWDAQDVVGCIGPQAAVALAQMSPARRYATYAQGAHFKVQGLSSTMAQVKDFQKYAALLGVIGQNPVLLQTFMQESSPKKILYNFYKTLNINPEDVALNEEERAALPQTMQQLPFFQQLANGNAGNQQGAVSPEGPGLQADVAAMNNPSAGV